MEGTTLSNLGLVCYAHGDYDTALEYYKQALGIQQEISDVATMCINLLNIGESYRQKNEMTEAMQTWVTVYGIAKKIKLAQALDALENLAGELGLTGGLEAWERLAGQMEDKAAE
jgi:tetratricopeptide (TPR) repeat protein